jgi:hypothetical protein
MLEINFWIVPVAALVPMILGFIWYHPNVMGKAWMDASGMTDEKIKSGNMPLIFGVSYLLSCFLASSMFSLTIHQFGFQSILIDEPGFGKEGSEIYTYFHDFVAKYGTNFRTFKHGALHGFIGAAFIAFPILGTNALFERKSWKYIWVNTGYWALTMTLMGGIVCQFA